MVQASITALELGVNETEEGTVIQNARPVGLSGAFGIIYLQSGPHRAQSGVWGQLPQWQTAWSP